ncbi:hypothetical protein NHQ30_000963 [Ciborinia camelliae]|nr:hypothetical protein NHQ30_000963 [Ciborinia camelliae]
MCNLIVTLCPSCLKAAAPSRLKKCVNKSGPFIGGITCTVNEFKIISKNPCESCNARQRPSSPTRLRTQDILEEMCLKIPEWRPAPPPEDPTPPNTILPNWSPETLAATQTEELFFEHITRFHCVEVKNREGLSSQRGGIPLCLVAGVPRRNRKPVGVYRRPPRFAPTKTSRVEGRGWATISLPLSARGNSLLGLEPAPRAKSDQGNQLPARTPSCLVPEVIEPRSPVRHENLVVSPLPTKSLKLQIPPEASASDQPQGIGSTLSSAKSGRSEYLLPGPSPQVQTFSAEAFAQIPSHYDLRPVQYPAPLHFPTPEQPAQEREQRETLDQISQRAQECQERERQQLESQRIRESQQRDDQRSRSEVAPPRTVNDVQFQSVRPSKSQRILRFISRLSKDRSSGI